MRRLVRRNVRRRARATLELVRHVAADDEERTLARIRDYLTRGRPLAGLPDESLDVNWVEPTWLPVHRKARGARQNSSISAPSSTCADSSRP